MGVQRRFVMFGGGVSQQQLQWLEQQIQVGVMFDARCTCCPSLFGNPPAAVVHLMMCWLLVLSGMEQQWSSKEVMRELSLCSQKSQAGLVTACGHV